MDAKRIARELDWLRDHPDFQERPATIEEFIGPDYLNIEGRVRKRIMTDLINIIGPDVNDDRMTKYPLAMMTGGIGIGKGQRTCDTVATVTGHCKVGDLKVGDEVIGANGRPTLVTGVFHRGVLPVYEVKFKDGASLVVDGDHLWAVDQQIQVRGVGRRWRREVLSTSELMNRKLKYGDNYVYKVPLVEPIHYAAQNLKIDPYLMGAVIANGHVSGSVRVAGPGGSEVEFQGYLEACLPSSVKPVVVEPEREGHSFTLATWPNSVSNSILTAFREYGLGDIRSRDKFIPEPYLLGNPDDRLALLRGLMDCDGSPVGNRTIYSTSSHHLAQDVQQLVRSLGGYATITEFERRSWTEYQVHINLDQVCPFRISRKRLAWKPRTNQRPRRSIVSIESAGHEEIICIQVAALDHLYVAGEDLIVTHNTTVASIVLPYLCHWVLCLKDPQDFFDLLPGSRIAFMQMSTSEKQALEVVFGDIKARILHSPWFMNNFPFDPGFKNQIRFPKDIWIIPGDSSETTFEGYNILGGILDEADSHKVTQNKDYAEQGYTTIHTRISSRFQERGFLLVIGQMKSGTGFAAKKYAELKLNPKAYAVRMAIWESLGWERFSKPDGTRDSFWYDADRKEIVPSGIASALDSENLIEVPNIYLQDFRNNPEKALRDLAGIPPATGSPFISLGYKITEAVNRWCDRYPGVTTPVDDRGRLAEWFYATNSLKRTCHIDMAYSASGDALGIAMGHVSEMVTIDGESKPYIIMDMLMRIHAPAGREIFIGDVRRLIYQLRDERKFRINKVTLDGFQSTDTRQQLERKRIETEIVSVDKQILPYHDLREAIYENRIDFPRYMVRVRPDDTALTEIALKELSELVDNGKKIDHPDAGSKDVADAMAGVVFTLMGERIYHKRLVRMGEALDSSNEPLKVTTGNIFNHPALTAGSGTRAPVPPVGPAAWKPPSRKKY